MCGGTVLLLPEASKALFWDWQMQDRTYRDLYSWGIVAAGLVGLHMPAKPLETR